MMRVVFFHRKRYSGVYSIESIFSRVRKSLDSDIVAIHKELRFISQGLFKRLYISIEAAFNQGDVNHITGDVNFIAFFLSGDKTVLTIHDVGYMNQRNRLMKYLLLWFWIRLPVKKCAIITTVSEATKKELLKFVAVAPEKIKVIPVSISDKFQAIPGKFNKERPTILQIGTKENKNIVRLIEAIKGVSCKLNIIGTLSEEQRDKLEFNKVAYEEFIDLTENEVIAKYAQCDMVSFVSTYEGFGMPIVEANAIGRVVVTSKLLSMPEVGADAVHYVDPFDINSIRAGIIKVISDEQYRNMLIAKGLMNSRRFDTKIIANQYLEIYRLLVAKKDSMRVQ